MSNAIPASEGSIARRAEALTRVCFGRTGQGRATPQEALCGTRHLYLRRELKDDAERRDLGHRAPGREAPAKAQWSADEGPGLSRKSNQRGGDGFRGRLITRHERRRPEHLQGPAGRLRQGAQKGAGMKEEGHFGLDTMT